MTTQELQARLDRLSAMASKLRELEQEVRAERDQLGGVSEPKLRAGYSMLTREVAEAASVAETLSHHPDLISA